MNKKNTGKAYTTLSGAELKISAPSTKQIISATNNRAQYFAEQAKKYRDEAKSHRDNAKYYAEQNSDVTFEYIDNIRASIEDKIATKQNKGDYALKNELPENVSELINDAEYVNQTEFNNAIAEVELPSQEGCAGRFLMSDGENESWVGINSFQLFDTKLSDHILTYEESKGWALQGTYVYKEAIAGSRYGYPDFYAKCLEEYNEATGTETVNGVTIKVHENGHKFFDFADKDSIDEIYNSTGAAWFYGIDTENERIFLPRNVARVLVESKKATDDDPNWYNLYSDGWCEQGGIITSTTYSSTPPSFESTISFSKPFKDANYSKAVTPLSDFAWNVPLQATKSSFSSTSAELYFYRVSNATYGADRILKYNWTFAGYTSETFTDKYSYICVGNTTSESAITDVVDVTTTDNDTVPLFTGQYFDFTPNNVSWLKAGEQANSGGIYATCYNELVNELTTPKYGLKVIGTSAMQSDVDYSEYWKVNQDDMTFTTPTAISNKALSGAVIGNGMTLGLTNGNVDLGLLGATSSSAPNTLHYGNPVAGQPVGTAYDVGTQYGNYSLGVTANAEKSGIIVEQSTAQLYFKVANAVENLELLDAGEVMNVLSEKISRQDCSSYVTSSYVNGTSWYRIYSDGWCEQGGYISGITSAWTTISFLKPFKDISYYFNRCNNSTVTDVATNWANEGWNDKTTNGVSCYNHLSYCTAFNWVACGYIS